MRARQCTGGPLSPPLSAALIPLPPRERVRASFFPRSTRPRQSVGGASIVPCNANGDRQLYRVTLAALMAVLMVALLVLPAAAQSNPTASRSFDPATVAPGGRVVVTITMADYGQAGGVIETLPAGFSYVSSSLDAGQVRELGNNQVRFTFQGDTSFTYTVTAADTPGEDYEFSGTLRDFERNDHTVDGASHVTVTAPTPTPTATPTPEPTATPVSTATPEPTATLESTCQPRRLSPRPRLCRPRRPSRLRRRNPRQRLRLSRRPHPCQPRRPYQPRRRSLWPHPCRRRRRTPTARTHVNRPRQPEPTATPGHGHA